LGEVKLQSGELISQGATLLEILDETQPHIVAHIPVGIASKMFPGSKVSIVFPMNQLRSGIISMIPPQTISSSDGSGSFVAVKIEPSGKLWPKLAFGSSVNVQLQ
jgi:hypothetical protein